MAIGGTGRANAPTKQPLKLDGTPKNFQPGSPSGINEKDGIHRFHDPLGKPTPHSSRRGAEHAMKEMAKTTRQNCLKIVPKPGSSAILEDGLKLLHTLPFPDVNQFGSKAPYRVSHELDGSLKFTSAKAAPPGEKNDTLTLKPDGEISYAAGPHRMDPKLNPAQRDLNAKHNMLRMFCAATNRKVAEPTGIFRLGAALQGLGRKFRK